MKTLKSLFIDHLKTKLPGLTCEPLESLVSENLLSEQVVQLPIKILKDAQEFIRACFELRENREYQNLLSQQMKDLHLVDPGNKSIMMSYDFHIDQSDQLKLIEINTNAAFLLLGYYLYECRGLPLPLSSFKIEQLKTCIQNELSLSGQAQASPRISIIDSSPQNQRLYIEFLVARELFSSWGWPTDIRDFRQALDEPRPHFIYNRFTDFYLTDAAAQNLRAAFLAKSICLSPNPFEYFLLADKERLNEWNSGLLEKIPDFQQQVDTIRRILPRSWRVTQENLEFLWSQRKTLFFKPTREYGSKGSFRGGSISRKTFEDLGHSQTMAQEFVPAPECSVALATGPVKFKYDLRFYTYKGELQLVLARLYQGQATNLRTAGGGFACVQFN